MAVSLPHKVDTSILPHPTPKTQARAAKVLLPRQLSALTTVFLHSYPGVREDPPGGAPDQLACRCLGAGPLWPHVRSHIT